MSMAEVATATVRVDGLIAVKSGEAIDRILPSLAARNIAALLSRDNLGSQEEVIAHEQVDLVGAHAGKVVDLLGGKLGSPVLVVKQAGLDGRGARAQNLDRCIRDTHGLGLLRGHHDNSCGTVALLLEAGNTQVLRDARVVHALEVLIGGIEPSCLRILLDRGLIPRKGIQDGAAAKALGKAVQGVIDLIGGKVVLH